MQRQITIRQIIPFECGADSYLLSDYARVYSDGLTVKCSCDEFKDGHRCPHVEFIRDVENGCDGSFCPLDPALSAQDEF